MLECLLELLVCLEPMLERLDCLEPLLMESRARSKLTKGVPRELHINSPCLCTEYLLAVTLARFSVSASGITITVSIAVSIAVSSAVSIIITVPLASFATFVPIYISAFRNAVVRAIFPKMIMTLFASSVAIFVVVVIARACVVIELEIVVVAAVTRMLNFRFSFNSFLYFL